MRFRACALFDADQPCGAQANMAKYLAAKASWEAANVCMQTHGGFGFAERIRHRAQVPRDAALPGGADIDEPDLRVHRRARARPAAVVLTVADATARERCVRSMASPSSRSSMRSPRRSARASSPTSVRASSRSSVPASAISRAAYDERVRGLASHFVWTNRSKESLTLDVKHPEAQAILERLIASARRLVQNLAPGAAARLGLSYEALVAGESAPHRLRHLGLRRRRAVSRQEGLRPADPERIGLPVGHRHAGRAGQGRLLDRRHRGGHVCLHATSSRR